MALLAYTVVRCPSSRELCTSLSDIKNSVEISPRSFSHSLPLLSTPAHSSSSHLLISTRATALRCRWCAVRDIASISAIVTQKSFHMESKATRLSAAKRHSKPSDGSSSYWPSIGTKDEIPGWLRDNDYILEGHPMPTHSYRRSFRLWRCLHMETMNIYSHLVGCLILAATGPVLYHRYSSSTLPLSRGDCAAFALFLVGGIICFGSSTAFHTLRSHSYHVHHFWGKMDILGISAFAQGGGTSMTYYTWYCRPVFMRAYWAINACSALAAAATLLDTGGGGSRMRALRGSVFTLVAFSAILPLFHGVTSLG